jgi:excisionase family DNA binding protein
MLSAQDQFLTVAEIAELLKLNQQTIRNMIDRGDLPAIRVGARRVRIRRADLEHFLEQGQTYPSQPAAKAPGQAFWDGDISPPRE